MRPRVIPVVLISDRYVVKPAGFKKPSYVGDPINTVKLFNEKQADELFVIDIEATRSGKGIDFEFVKDVVSEAFMPVAYGGGISSLEQAAQLFALGVEKVLLHDACFSRPEVVTEISTHFGTQAVVAAVDVRRRRFGKVEVVHHSGGPVDVAPEAWARRLQELGAGEVLLTVMEREGSRRGFDLDLVVQVARELSVPLVVNGGADTVADFAPAIRAGASAVAAGSMFTFHGPRKAVLIQYPADGVLNSAFDYSPTADLAASGGQTIERESGA